MLERFSNRAEVYDKYRPGYPQETIGIIMNDFNHSEKPIIADIGAGTGIMTEMLSPRSSKIFCVEPNQDMISIARKRLKNFQNVEFTEHSAENTNIRDNYVDAIVVAQAFHWFDLDKAKEEFKRILKKEGTVALTWNKRRESGSEFLEKYEHFLFKYAKDYENVRYKNVKSDGKDGVIDKDKIKSFFGGKFETYNFSYDQNFNFEDLKGRLLSTSYSLLPHENGYSQMIDGLERVFAETSHDEMVTFKYDSILIISKGIK